MKKVVSFYGSKSGETLSFIFCDPEGNQYFLDERICPTEGMNPFFYDQITNLKNIKVETKDIDGRHYINKVYITKKNIL